MAWLCITGFEREQARQRLGATETVGALRRTQATRWGAVRLELIAMPHATPPLALSDSQLDQIMRLAQPLQPAARDAFLRILAHEFRGRHDIGDGELHRVAVETIKSYRLFDAPDLARGHVPRWPSRRRNGIIRSAAEG